MKNKKGAAPLAIILVAYAIGATVAGTATLGVIETAKNGQLKNNGQSIWAHMQGLCTGETPDARCILK